MRRFGWDLPPGVTASMLPGNSPDEQRAEAESEAVWNTLSEAGVADDVLDAAGEKMLEIIATVRTETAADCAADERMVREMAESVYLRKVDANTDNECWVICAKGDPGATRFIEAT